jgi:heme A synthase
VVTTRFRAFSRVVLVATLAVIAFGAYVRASGSGAGCGNHWPTCNGEVIPRQHVTATLIEFTHRATTGIITLLIAAQLVWAFRIFPRRHRVRKAAVWSCAFLVSEAMIGAGLVLFRLVADDASTARAASISAHLVNTFLLLSSLTLTGFWAKDPVASLAQRHPASTTARIGAGLLATIAVGATGAVAALGDTLFPSRSLSAGVANDFSAGGHLFERLRAVHPVLAVLTAIYLLIVALHIQSEDASLRPHARVVSWLVYVQVAVGLINLWLLAPVAMQLVHLLVADLLFIALVQLGAASWRVTDDGSAEVRSAPADEARGELGRAGWESMR